MNRSRRDPRQPPRYDRPMSPHRHTSESCLPYSRTSRPTRNSSPPLSFRRLRDNSSPSHTNPTLLGRRQTPDRFLHVPTSPRRRSPPTLAYRQARSFEDKEKNRPFTPNHKTGLSVLSAVPPPTRQYATSNQVKASEVGFQTPPGAPLTDAHHVDCSLVSGIWALHTPPNSHCVRQCTIYLHGQSNEHPRASVLSSEVKLTVQLSRHASGGVPLDVHSFKDHRNLTMVTDTCKGWDSVIVEVNPDQKTGKTFLLDDLANNNRTPLDITPWIVNGSNIIRCIQLSGDADVFLLHASSTPSSIKISPPELLYPSEFAYNVESDDLGRPGSDTGNPPQLPYPSIHEMEALDFATALDQQLYGNRVVES